MANLNALIRNAGKKLSASGLFAVSGILIFSPGGGGKAQSAAPPSFDVVSVKQRPMPAGMVIRRPHFNSGAIDCSNPMSIELFDCGLSGTRFSDSPASLLDLIIDAYNVRSSAVLGLPEWGD
jgi:hypothetical protein